MWVCFEYYFPPHIGCCKILRFVCMFTLSDIHAAAVNLHLIVLTVRLMKLISYRHKEAYTWTYPMCCVHNIILGKLWIEQYGTVEIVNHRYSD